MICHIFPTQEVLFLVALVRILEVHEDYQEDLEYESSDSDEAGLGRLGGWVGFGFRRFPRGNSRSLHCLSRCCGRWRIPSLVPGPALEVEKKHHPFFVVFPEMPS